MTRRSRQDDLLLAEYKTFVHEAHEGKSDMDEGAWDRIECLLFTEGDWSRKAAAQLASLARAHGAFVLRNALALATAAGIEDGTSGI
jgi:hypothetical protein